MIKIGEYNELTVLRSTSVGLFLGDNEDNDILLPRKYVTENMKMTDVIKVFVYNDSEDRMVATTETPYVVVDQFALLKVVDSNRSGAFLYWGLEKDLMVPANEQRHPMKVGQSYLIFMYLDESTNRLVGSSRISEFLSNEEVKVKERDEVDLIIYEKTDLGYNAIINNYYKGLVYKNEIFKTIEIGDRLKGYIKTIREDKNIDLSLQPLGLQNLESAAQQILDHLKKHSGFLSLNDDSSPDEIYSKMQMSKKSFKKGLGILYKQKLVRLEPNGVYLL
ncbi:MAG: S1-like domain-containing RNA-binding protein [bacterium]|nr:S1-like domain-containing RNA-binding protein [bacterium]